MLAAINRARLRPSSMVSGIWGLAGELMQDLREMILAFSLFIRHWRSYPVKRAEWRLWLIAPPPQNRRTAGQ
jgi:hypothetical protein